MQISQLFTATKTSPNHDKILELHDNVHSCKSAYEHRTNIQCYCAMVFQQQESALKAI